MAEEVKETGEMVIKKPPVGLAVLVLVGPSIVWAAEYVGSGECKENVDCS